MDMSRAVQDVFFLNECQDGFIDEQNFLRLMCPPEYRLSDMDNFARSVFGQILAFQASQAKTALEGVLGKNGQTHMEKPHALRPIVSMDQWRDWEAVFQQLDQDRNELVSAKDMITSNVLTELEAEAMVKLFDPENSKHVSKVAFMTTMLKASGFRLVDPSGSPL